MYASYEDIEYDATCATKVLTARNAIKKILAHPEQEPVAFYNPQHGGFYWAKPTTIHAPQAVDIVPLALYTSPPKREWKGLTDEEIYYFCHLAYTGDEEFLLAVEAKLKEKNT